MKGSTHSPTNMVHAPDYYAGEVFDDLGEGLRKRDTLGYAEIAQGAGGRRRAARGAGLRRVLARDLASRASGRHYTGHPGVVLMHGAVPIEGFSGFGVDRWPEGVPVRVHYAVGDPCVEAGEVAALGDAIRRAGTAFEEHAYPGSGHLFADPDLPEYDRAASEAMWERVLVFLDQVDARRSGVEGTL